MEERDDPRIRIRRRAGRDRVEIEVADNGPGIPADRLEQIFDPFFTTKEQGSGLGLYIAHRIVAEHGGTIVVTARPDGGTIFRITFRGGGDQDGRYGPA